MRFNGKKVIVTGSASAIGSAIAYAFAVEGASLGLIDLKPSQLVAAQGASERKHFESIADLADLPALQAASGNASSHLQGVDILVNAAGVTSFGSAAQLPEAEWDRVIAINLKS